MALTIPVSRVKTFYSKGWDKHQRLGQAFHMEMQLWKITGEDKSLCDKLLSVPDAEARKIIESITDWEN